MRKHLGTILIIVGLTIVIVPLIGRMVANRKQEELMNEYYLEEEQAAAVEIDAAYQQLDEIFETGGEDATETALSGEAPTVDPVTGEVVDNVEESTGTLKVRPKVLGVIRIPQISVAMPIAEGSTSEILNYYIGHMEGTAALGEIGNAVLAGHRGYSYGVYFYRLDELEIGDEIYIESKGETYTYTIYEKKFVQPDDLSVLRGSSKYKVLTLITCDPPIHSTRRLIVHAIVKN